MKIKAIIYPSSITFYHYFISIAFIIIPIASSLCLSPTSYNPIFIGFSVVVGSLVSCLHPAKTPTAHNKINAHNKRLVIFFIKNPRF